MTPKTPPNASHAPEGVEAPDERYAYLTEEDATLELEAQGHVAWLEAVESEPWPESLDR